MGTTFSSCSHFVADKLLYRWRQATVILAGCMTDFLVLAHSVLILQPIAFRLSLLQPHPPAVHSVFLANHLPGRSVFRICSGSFLAIRLSAI